VAGVADSFGEMAGSLTGVPSANWCCSNISRARNCGSLIMSRTE
jgi:hypothetical protein